MKRLKIGYVISYAEEHNNFGSMLQAYALLKKMQDLGHDVKIIRYIRKRSLFDKVVLLYRMVQCKETKQKIILLKRKISVYKSKYFYNNIKIRSTYVNIFKELYLKPHFCIFRGYDDLKKSSILFDVVVVGSDQVWSPLSLYTRFTNLLFVDDLTPKISYASSFGVSTIPKSQLLDTAYYLNRFNDISTREMSGKEIVETISNKKAEVVADPTLLMSSKEWIDFIFDVKIEETQPYIFCYLLGGNKMHRAEILKFQQKTGLKIVTIRHMDEYLKVDETFGDYAPYNVGPKEFIKYIQNAEYVFTDSFHCTAFSLQFNRKFMTFYRYNSNEIHSRNTRITSLLCIVGLENRIYSRNIFEVMDHIDYDVVNEKLNKFRLSSQEFLIRSFTNITV
jgi:hypothetical protein